MSRVADAEIDAAIISELGPLSLKTSRVIYCVGEKFENTSSSFLDRIAGRIATLIEARNVQVVGNLADWRRSELWLTPPST